MSFQLLEDVQIGALIEYSRWEFIVIVALFLRRTHVGVLQRGKIAGFDLGTRQSNYECTFQETSSRARPPYEGIKGGGEDAPGGVEFGFVRGRGGVEADKR